MSQNKRIQKYEKAVWVTCAEFPYGAEKDRRRKEVREFRKILIEALHLLKENALASAEINGDIVRIGLWYRDVLCPQDSPDCQETLQVGWVADMGGAELDREAAESKIKKAEDELLAFYWKELQPEYLTQRKGLYGRTDWRYLK